MPNGLPPSREQRLREKQLPHDGLKPELSRRARKKNEEPPSGPVDRKAGSMSISLLRAAGAPLSMAAILQINDEDFDVCHERFETTLVEVPCVVVSAVSPGL